MEWLIIVLLAGYMLVILFPRVLIDKQEGIKEAKRLGQYQKVDLPAQTYYGKRFWIDGVSYVNQELEIFVSGMGSGSNGKIPHTLIVKTDKGVELQWIGGGGSSDDVWMSRGSYRFSDVPSDVKEIIVHQYGDYPNGDTFSFRIPLEEGVRP